MRKRSNIFIQKQEVLLQLSLKTNLEGMPPKRTYKRDVSFSTLNGVVNLHPTEFTHLVLFFNENYVEVQRCPPPHIFSILRLIENRFDGCIH